MDDSGPSIWVILSFPRHISKELAQKLSKSGLELVPQYRMPTLQVAAKLTIAQGQSPLMIDWLDHFGSINWNYTASIAPNVPFPKYNNNCKWTHQVLTCVYLHSQICINSTSVKSCYSWQKSVFFLCVSMFPAPIIPLCSMTEIGILVCV